MITLSAHANEPLANEPLECLIEPHLVIEISSSEIGVLASVPVDTADVVRKGDVVAALHTDVEQAALEISRTRASSLAEIRLLQNEYDFTARKRDRFDELHEQRMVSAQDVDEVQSAKESAALRLQAATENQRRYQLEAAQDELALARRIVRSPLDGVVIKRYKANGEFVDGDPILQLAQLDPLRIEVVVPIAQYGKIQVGMEATVLPEMPIDGPFVASVTRIDPIMDAATATFGVRLSLPNPAHRLPAGLKCSLILHTDKVPPAAAALPGKQDSSSNTALPAATDTRSHTSTPGPVGCNPLESDPSAAACQHTVAKAAPRSISPQTNNPGAIDTQSNTKQNDNVRPVTSHKDTSCSTLGPILDAATEEHLTAELSAKQVQYERRYQQVSMPKPPWTLLSRESHSTPERLIERLKEAGIQDLQWLRSGTWKHHISFGRFRDESNARAHQTRLTELGFETDIVPHRYPQTTLWLDLQRSASNPGVNSIIAMQPGVQAQPSLLPISCPQFASR